MNARVMDLRVALRSLVRRPAFTGVALATLSLSIGAATLLFSVVDGVLLSPLPYENPDELVTVYLTNDEWRISDNELLRNAWDVQTMTLAHAEAFRGAPGPITGMTAYTSQTLPLEPGDGTAEEARAILVDPETFALLGVSPFMGRLPTGEEIRREDPVAVIRYETWTTRFGGDPDVLGRSFRLGGRVDRTLTVIGVMPRGFFFPTEAWSDLWTPVYGEARDWPSFYGVARLTAGASVEEASEFFESVARRVGDENAGQSGRGGRAVPHSDSVVGSVRGGIQLLFGTALLVVLVACANIGNLFLGRTAGRGEELAVRASLGAGAGSLASTVLAEVLVVGLVGGGIGVLLAGVTVGPFVEALASSLRGLPRQDAIGFDATVLLFSLVSSVVTMLAAGVGPVFLSARRAQTSGVGSRLRSGAGRATRSGQRLLLSVQGALTVVLVLAAALLVRSFFAAASVDMGMATEQVAVLEVRADWDRYTDAAHLTELHETVHSRVARVPSVSSVGLASSLPSQGGILLQHVRPEGADSLDVASVSAITVGEDYFASLGMPVLMGRGFGGGGVGEVVVSEGLALQVFGRRDIVGDRLLMGSGGSPEVLEVVGVVGAARQLSVFHAPSPSLYYPMTERARRHFYLTMAVDGDPVSVLQAAREGVLGVDETLEIELASTLPHMLDESMRHVRMQMILMASLAALAGVLAMIGISGVVAHFLSEQTRDVGIRMALGAAAGREVGRVVGQAFLPTVVGVAVGVGVALPASTVMQSFLFGVEPIDAPTYLAVTGALLVTALLAAWIPARRTAAVDPVRVLKSEV